MTEPCGWGAQDRLGRRDPAQGGTGSNAGLRGPVAWVAWTFLVASLHPNHIMIPHPARSAKPTTVETRFPATLTSRIPECLAGGSAFRNLGGTPTPTLLPSRRPRHREGRRGQGAIHAGAAVHDVPGTPMSSRDVVQQFDETERRLRGAALVLEEDEDVFPRMRSTQARRSSVPYSSRRMRR